MKCLVWMILLVLGLGCAMAENQGSNVEQIMSLLPADLKDESPTVLIALMVRNKAHILPYVLSYLEQQNYPKHRLALWIRSDHNSDNSIELLQLWLNHTQKLYHSVSFEFDNSTQRHQNESSAYDWPAARFKHLIKLKEAALTYAHKIWADYIFYLDADVLLTSPETIRHLVGLKVPVVAPLLLSEGLYSNFWCGMTKEFYYQRTDEYKEIYNANKEGVFPVPMIHSAVLINLNYMGARYLTFDKQRLIAQQKVDAVWSASLGRHCQEYNGPLDDTIVFAISANCSQIPLAICNELPFGYIMQPLEVADNQTQDELELTNIKANMIHDLGAVPKVSDYFESYLKYPSKDKISFDKIFMINLERRPERRRKMEQLFSELGLEVEHFAAVDGKQLNLEIMKEMEIKFLPGYEDPFHHRQMTMGEIGCFLSHYRIWEHMVKENLSEVLILEDDIRFEPYFKERAVKIMEQARRVVEYDLVYFGRKRLKEESEPWVAGTENLVHVGYSYWTLGYAISKQGALKLLAAKPLEKLIPVDEFLPLMFNRHPNKTWSAAYPERNLLAFSAAPLILYPSHYTGDVGYISDTEDSELTATNLFDAASTSSNDAQLKSDREQYFEMPENSQSENLKAMFNNINNMAAAEKHEEL